MAIAYHDSQEAHEWMVEVTKLVIQLTREVHALNPGIQIEADLAKIVLALE